MGLSGSAVPALAAGAGVTVSGGWMRFIIPARPAAGYFKLTNTGEATKTLTGASSPDCGMVMLHKSMTKSGSAAMMDVDHVDVAPGKSVTFAPGGYHLMCMNPKPTMKSAKSVPMTLTFKDGSSVESAFTVKGAGGK